MHGFLVVLESLMVDWGDVLSGNLMVPVSGMTVLTVAIFTAVVV